MTTNKGEQIKMCRLICWICRIYLCDLCEGGKEVRSKRNLLPKAILTVQPCKTKKVLQKNKIKQILLLSKKKKLKKGIVHLLPQFCLAFCRRMDRTPESNETLNLDWSWGFCLLKDNLTSFYLKFTCYHFSFISSQT